MILNEIEKLKQELRDKVDMIVWCNKRFTWYAIETTNLRDVLKAWLAWYNGPFAILRIRSGRVSSANLH